ncbi:MAG TPA: hypothetical protein VM512_04625, partial [Burkholderiaceae bacterium]|nr:hypothetical protein [Burkholderiaceae bacterium]
MIKNNVLANPFASTIDPRAEKRCISVVQSLLQAGIDLFEEGYARKRPIDYLHRMVGAQRCDSVIT